MRHIFLENLDKLKESKFISNYEFVAINEEGQEGKERLTLTFPDGTILEVNSAMYPTGFDTYLLVK